MLTAPDAAPVWTVYILECADTTLYCGVTTDLSRRLDQHNGRLPGGAKYTRSRRPVLLRAAFNAGDKRTAFKIEKRIKRLPRAKKLSSLTALTQKLNDDGRNRAEEADTSNENARPGNRAILRAE